MLLVTSGRWLCQLQVSLFFFDLRYLFCCHICSTVGLFWFGIHGRYQRVATLLYTCTAIVSVGAVLFCKQHTCSCAALQYLFFLYKYFLLSLSYLSLYSGLGIKKYGRWKKKEEIRAKKSEWKKKEKDRNKRKGTKSERRESRRERGRKVKKGENKAKDVYTHKKNGLNENRKELGSSQKRFITKSRTQIQFFNAYCCCWLPLSAQCMSS